MKKIILYFFPLFTIGCTGLTVSSERINLDQLNEVSIFDVVDSIQIVPLETNSQGLIARIGKVIVFEDRYYILDAKQQVVFCFDQQGAYLFKIAQRGQGPTEYAYLEDIVIDPYNRQLLLVVPYGDILYFDLEGNFLLKDRIPDAGAINEVHVLDKEKLLFISLNMYQVLYYDKVKKQIISRLYPDRLFPLLPLDRTYSYGDSVYFAAIFGNEILNMSTNSPKESYVWDFGKRNHTAEQQTTLRKYLEVYEQRQNRKEMIWVTDIVGDNNYFNYYIQRVHESSRYRIALLEYQQDYYHVFIDKKQRKFLIFKRTNEGLSFMLDEFRGEYAIAYDKGYSGPRDIKYFAKSTLSPSQLKIVESHNPETDNPFLVVYHLKQ